VATSKGLIGSLRFGAWLLSFNQARGGQATQMQWRLVWLMFLANQALHSW